MPRGWPVPWNSLWISVLCTSELLLDNDIKDMTLGLLDGLMGTMSWKFGKFLDLDLTLNEGGGHGKTVALGPTDK